MFRTIIKLLPAACLLLLPAFAGAQPRETVALDRNWEFFTQAAVSSDNARKVNLPHTWNNDAAGGNPDYYRGSGSYQKAVDIPAEWTSRRVFLRCGGASTETQLLVNGHAAGTHLGALTPFAFEITEHIHAGERNVLRLITSNAQRQDVFPLAGDHNVYGGLLRGVELIATGPAAIAFADGNGEGVRVVQKKVSPEKAEGEIAVKVSGVGSAPATVSILLRTPAGDTVDMRSAKVKLDGRAASVATLPFSVAKPRLWAGTEDPFLYRLTVSVEANGKITDTKEISTGFRTVSVEPSGALLLNGKQYPVRGVAVTQDRPVYGPALTRAEVEKDFELIREMGANMVRVKDFMHHPYFYELCDREGILVWNDFPLAGETYLTDIGFINTDALRKNGERQVLEIMNELYNRPSVVMWGLFSDFSLRGDSPLEYLRSLNALVKREDPSRPTVASSNADGEINFITDLIVWNHHFGWLEGQPSDIDAWLKALHANWKQLRSGVSYKAGASVRQQSDTLRRPDTEGNWHPEAWQTYLHEEYFRRLAPDSLLWGTVVCNMFDYGAAGRMWGEGNGINDYGLVTIDRSTRKDAYYLYKANWNREDRFVYITGRRLSRRYGKAQTLRAYTNADSAELYVNGSSRGAKAAAGGIVEWPGVELSPGSNLIEVRSGEVSDRCAVDMEPAPTRHRGRRQEAP